jgi:hypothetical protein
VDTAGHESQSQAAAQAAAQAAGSPTQAWTPAAVSSFFPGEEGTPTDVYQQQQQEYLQQQQQQQEYMQQQETHQQNLQALHQYCQGQVPPVMYDPSTGQAFNPMDYPEYAMSLLSEGRGLHPTTQ